MKQWCYSLDIQTKKKHSPVLIQVIVQENNHMYYIKFTVKCVIDIQTIINTLADHYHEIQTETQLQISFN